MKSSTLEMKSALQRDGNKHHLLRRDLEIQHLSVKAGLFNTENQRSLVNQHNQGYGRGFCFNCSQRSRFEEVARVEGLNPPHSVISNLANELGLTFTQISDWFRHKRRKSLDAEDIWTPLQILVLTYLEMLKQIQEMRYELIRLHQSYRNYFFSLSQLNYQHRHHLHQFFKTQSML